MLARLNWCGQHLTGSNLSGVTRVIYQSESQTKHHLWKIVNWEAIGLGLTGFCNGEALEHYSVAIHTGYNYWWERRENGWKYQMRWLTSWIWTTGNNGSAISYTWGYSYIRPIGRDERSSSYLTSGIPYLSVTKFCIPSVRVSQAEGLLSNTISRALARHVSQTRSTITWVWICPIGIYW